MSNQYCKITSWIQHHKDHGDEKYAEAIMDLCLDSWLKPSKYNGLTFLYQTSKSIRKKFCDKVFTPDAREACEEFKRYILPDVFHSCEDFQQKDVGNVLGYKYEIKSCDKNKVVFDNGMEIHALLGHNSFEALSPNLKDIIKIYYVVKGEPPESGEPYRVTHRRREKKTVGGTYTDCNRIFTEVILPILQAPGFKLNGAYSAFNRALQILKDENHMVSPNTINDLIASQHIVSTTESGILNYIFYILDTIWDEKDAAESAQLAILGRKLLNAIIEELRNEYPKNAGKERYYQDFYAACEHIFTPADITPEVLNKMTTMMDAAIAEHSKDPTKHNILDLYLSKAASNGVLWGIKLFPVIEGKEKLHESLLSQRLLTCATEKSSLGHQTTDEEFEAKLMAITRQYQLSLNGEKSWEMNPQLVRAMIGAIHDSINHKRTEQPVSLEAIGDGALTGHGFSSTLSGLKTGVIQGGSENPESYF